MNCGRRFVTLYRRQRARTSPRKRNAKKAKWLSKEALQIAEKRKPRKAFNAKKQRKTREWERLEIALRKLEIPREHFL